MIPVIEDIIYGVVGVLVLIYICSLFGFLWDGLKQNFTKGGWFS